MEERILSRSETSGRSDDNLDALKKRFVTYMEST
jgi:UMP-CMP kinase